MSDNTVSEQQQQQQQQQHYHTGPVMLLSSSSRSVAATAAVFSRRSISCSARVFPKSRQYLWVVRSAQRRRHNSSSSSSKSGGSGSSGAKEEAPKQSALYTAEFWGALGAVAGWGMGLSGIYDAFSSGPEVISLTMTPVLIVYSSLFVRWALIVNPRNVPLAACHATNVVSQLNQLRRALDYKLQHGQEQQVKDITQKAAFGGACIAGSIVLGPTLRAALTKNTQLGPVSTIAAADAGPFT